MKTYRVYFRLFEEMEPDPVVDERVGLKEIWELLSPYAESSRLESEGHTSNGDLLCYFHVSEKLEQLEACIRKNRGGGDDFIFLPCGYTAGQFELVELPGMSQPVPFDDWDEVLERKTGE